MGSLFCSVVLQEDCFCGILGWMVLRKNCILKRKDVSRSLSVHQSINSDNYESAISLVCHYLIDLLAILRKILDRAIFLNISMHEVRLSGVRGSMSIVHIRKFQKML